MKRETIGEVLDCKQAGGLALSVTRFDPLRATPWHSHDSACLTVVLAGGYEEALKGKAREHSSGTLNYKPPGEVHRNLYRGPATTLVFQFDSTASAREQLGLPILRECFSFHSPDVASMGRSLWREIGADDASALAVQCRFFDLLNLASGERGRTRPRASVSTVALARDWLHANFRASLDLSAIADKIGVTPSYLARVFRSALGCTLGQYQRQLRVARALERIRGGARRLADVAREAGFSDQSHMNRVFRRHLGLTPGAYRDSLA